MELMTHADAVALARAAAPDFLRDARPLPAYENERRIVVAYQRNMPADVIADLYVAVVDRATRDVRVAPFTAMIDDLADMRDIPA